jgi:hypothetical protein
MVAGVDQVEKSSKALEVCPKAFGSVFSTAMDSGSYIRYRPQCGGLQD